MHELESHRISPYFKLLTLSVVSCAIFRDSDVVCIVYKLCYACYVSYNLWGVPNLGWFFEFLTLLTYVSCISYVDVTSTATVKKRAPRRGYVPESTNRMPVSKVCAHVACLRCGLRILEFHLQGRRRGRVMGVRARLHFYLCVLEFHQQGIEGYFVGVGTSIHTNYVFPTSWINCYAHTAWFWCSLQLTFLTEKMDCTDAKAVSFSKHSHATFGLYWLQTWGNMKMRIGYNNRSAKRQNLLKVEYFSQKHDGFY